MDEEDFRSLIKKKLAAGRLFLWSEKQVLIKDLGGINLSRKILHMIGQAQLSANYLM